MRKKGKYLVLDIIEATNNANIVLEKIYFEGLFDESVLVISSSIKLIFKILEAYSTSLFHNKASTYSSNNVVIGIIKQIMEKIIVMAMSSKHIEIKNNSKEFLDKLFWLKIRFS